MPSLKDNARIRGDEEREAVLEEVRVVEDDRAIVKHVFGNMYRLDKSAISDPNYMKRVVEEALASANMELIEIKLWTVGGKKAAVSVIAFIQGGHVALHSWNEYNYATLDIYTSGGRADPSAIFGSIVRKLRPKRHQVFNVDRSQMDI